MYCWARYLFFIVVAALGILSMLGACGQKGPLYLPEATSAKPATQESDVPRPPEATEPTAPGSNQP